MEELAREVSEERRKSVDTGESARRLGERVATLEGEAKEREEALVAAKEADARKSRQLDEQVARLGRQTAQLEKLQLAVTEKEREVCAGWQGGRGGGGTAALAPPYPVPTIHTHPY